MLGLCARVVCWTAEYCDYERESKSPPCRKVRDKCGAPSSLDSNYLELCYATGLNLFAAGIV
jgi:hypothetical protein